MNGKYYYIDKTYSLDEENFKIITSEKCKDCRNRISKYKIKDFRENEKYFIFNFSFYARIINMSRVYDIRLVTTSKELFLGIYFSSKSFDDDGCNADNFFDMLPDIFIFGTDEIKKFAEGLKKFKPELSVKIKLLLEIGD